jgi:molecular chaperone DnaK
MTRVPAVQEKVLEIFGKSPSKGVNPDEIVAIGAATQSAIMGGELEEVILLDVTPHDLGIRATGDRMSVVIPANTSIPTRAKKIFATTEDNQDFVSIDIHQGPDSTASKNRFLGRFILGNLPTKPKGQVRVEVALSIDANGILHVAATDLTSGRAASVTIETTSGLSPDELQRLIDSSSAR